MTSTGGSRSFNGQNIDRTRLVVPRLHQSVWASSQPAIMGSDHVLNRTGRTIQPLNQTNNNADDINHAVNNSAHTTSADGFMPTIPQYSDQAIPVHRSQSVVRQAATSPVQQNSQQVQPTVQPVRRQLSDADRRAIMERAALLRQQAREQAEAKDFFVCYGSALRRGEVSYFASLSKLFVMRQADGRMLDLRVEGQPRIRASFRAATRPSVLRVNGTAERFEYGKETVTFKSNI